MPDDIALVSFDNDELASYCLRPGLTTIALPHDDMGRLAVELVLLGGRAKGEHLVPMPIVVRGSIRKLYGGGWSGPPPTLPPPVAPAGAATR